MGKPWNGLKTVITSFLIEVRRLHSDRARLRSLNTAPEWHKNARKGSGKVSNRTETHYQFTVAVDSEYARSIRSSNFRKEIMYINVYIFPSARMSYEVFEVPYESSFGSVTYG